MMFHLSADKLILFKVYKRKHPKGKVYLKLDINEHQIDKYIRILGETNTNSFLTRFMLKKITKYVDLISCETLKYYKKIRETEVGRIFGDKLHYITNGISKKEIDQTGVTIKKYSEKENIFLFSGTLGSTVKNVNMLLEALKLIDLKDWKVYLIGSTDRIDYDFNKAIATFFEDNGNLSEKVFVEGFIENRKTLMEYYNRSKCFIMTSNYESFGLVLAEAAYFGNYLISTNVGAAEEISHSGEFGSLIEVGDAHRLAREMKKVITGEIDISANANRIHEYIKNNYTWENIVKQEVFRRLFETP
jgi:glycosyltransferase involved in cell wall biosynthesis